MASALGASGPTAEFFPQLDDWIGHVGHRVALTVSEHPGGSGGSCLTHDGVLFTIDPEQGHVVLLQHACRDTGSAEHGHGHVVPLLISGPQVVDIRTLGVDSAEV